MTVPELIEELWRQEQQRREYAEGNHLAGAVMLDQDATEKGYYCDGFADGLAEAIRLLREMR